jgi:HD-GYP domain-containing protein (c-di-GMP phosphodiesterase class II)
MNLARLLDSFARTAQVQLTILTRAGIERLGSEEHHCRDFEASLSGPCMKALSESKGEVIPCGNGYEAITTHPKLKGLLKVLLCAPKGKANLKALGELLCLQLEPYHELGLELPDKNPLMVNLRSLVLGMVVLRELEDALGGTLVERTFFTELVRYAHRVFKPTASFAMWQNSAGEPNCATRDLKVPTGKKLLDTWSGFSHLPTRHTPVKLMENKHFLRFEHAFGQRPHSGVGLELSEKSYLILAWDDEETASEQLHQLEVLQEKLQPFVRRLELYSGLEDSYLSTVRTIVNSLEARDQYHRGHSERVMRYSIRLGRAVSLSPEQLTDLSFAAILHDIGKIGLAESILGKAGSLDEAEWVIIRRHPIVGEALVGSVPRLSEVAKIIRHHHERFDGEGYPNRLAGKEIPLLARILSIAEAFDAMTSERPFRHPLPLERALVELEGNADSQFDPELIKLFVENNCHLEPA